MLENPVSEKDLVMKNPFFGSSLSAVKSFISEPIFSLLACYAIEPLAIGSTGGASNDLVN